MQWDQIQQPIFPYEGTRRTPAPIVPPLEGTGGSLGPSYTYIMRDRVTGTIYNVTLTPFGIQNGHIVYWTTSLPTLVQMTPSEDDLIWDGIRATGGWDIYVANGALASEYQPGPTTLEIVDGICDFGTVPSNCIIYLRDVLDDMVYVVDFSERPPTATLADNQSVTPVFDAAEIPNGFYAIVSGTLIATTSVDPEWVIYTNSCLDTVPVGGTDGIPVPFTVDCPTSVVNGYDVTFAAVPPINGVTNYHWDFGDGESLNTGTDPNAVHTYTQAATFNVVLTVTALGENESSVNCPVTVSIVVLSCPATVISGLQVDFTAAAPSSGVVTNYHWDFGDGSTTDTGVTTTTSHTYLLDGTYDVTVTATLVGGSTIQTSGCTVAVSSAPTVDGPPLTGSCIPTFGPGSGGPGSVWAFTNMEVFDIGGGVYGAKLTDTSLEGHALINLGDTSSLCPADSSSVMTYGADLNALSQMGVAISGGSVTGTSPVPVVNACGIRYGAEGTPSVRLRSYNRPNLGAPQVLDLYIFQFQLAYFYNPAFYFGTQTEEGSSSGIFSPCDVSLVKYNVFYI